MTDPVERRFERTLARLRARTPEPSEALRARVREVAADRRPAAVPWWRVSPSVGLALCTAVVLLGVGAVALMSRGTPDARERIAGAEERMPSVTRAAPDARPGTRRARESAREPSPPPREGGSTPGTRRADERPAGRATAPAMGDQEQGAAGEPPRATPSSPPPQASSRPHTPPPNPPRGRPDGSRGRPPAPRTQTPLPGTPTPPPTVTPVRSGTADLAVEAVGAPDVVAVGGTVTYTVTIRNDGPERADGVTMTIVLSSNVSLLSASASRGTCGGATTITCALGSIANGEEARITLVARAAAVGEGSSTATAQGSPPDPNASNNSTAVATTIVAAPPGAAADPRALRPFV